MVEIINEGSVLKDSGSYKNKVISAILISKDVCDLMMYGRANYTEDDVDNLIYTQIFPYLYTDETQKETLPYICVEVDLPRVPTRTIKDMKLIIWAYSHKDIMKYSKKGFSGTRVDILADMIERQLRDSDKFGIGKLELQSCSYFFPQSKYYGKQLIYNMPDFKISR